MSKKKVLIIDDEEMLLDSIAMLLNGHGPQVETFSDPEKGLDFLKNNIVECLVCDLKMPKLSGIELIQKFRATNLKTPIIVFSAYLNEMIKSKLKSIGVDTFIDKSELDLLLETVHGHLA